MKPSHDFSDDYKFSVTANAQLKDCYFYVGTINVHDQVQIPANSNNFFKNCN